MPRYEYKCKKGHITEVVCRYTEKMELIECGWCGFPADSIVSKCNISGCWPEGRVFPQVNDKKSFKNYTELDKHLEKQGSCVDNKTSAQLKQMHEERKQRKGVTIKPKPKKIKIPDKVDKAFREASNVKQAIRALKEGRV